MRGATEGLGFENFFVDADADEGMGFDDLWTAAELSLGGDFWTACGGRSILFFFWLAKRLPEEEGEEAECDE